MKSKIILLLLLISIALSAQTTGFTEDFSSRKDALSSWDGTWKNWGINAYGQLQLQTDSASQSFLIHETYAAIDAEWKFWTRVYGGCSSYNLTRFYLMQTDSVSGDGYYVQVGGANKNVVLYHQSNGTIKKIIENEDRKQILPEDARVEVRLTRESDSVFRLYSYVEDVDYEEQLEGESFVGMLSVTKVALYAKNTKARGKDMYFDDISVAGDEQTSTIDRPDSIHSNSSTDVVFHLLTETITPNGDMYEDEARIEYTIPDGYRVNLNVYTADGLLVNSLLRNMEIAPSGVLVWNGTNNRGDIVEIGVYVLVAEFTSKSSKQVIRKRFPVAVLH